MLLRNEALPFGGAFFVVHRDRWVRSVVAVIGALPGACCADGFVLKQNGC